MYNSKYFREACQQNLVSLITEVSPAWAFCQRKDCKSGSALLRLGQFPPTSAPVCLSELGRRKGQSYLGCRRCPGWCQYQCPGEVLLLASVTKQIAAREHQGHCLALITLCTAAAAVRWQRKGHLPSWQTCQGDDGRDAPRGDETTEGAPDRTRGRDSEMMSETWGRKRIKKKMKTGCGEVLWEDTDRD